MSDTRLTFKEMCARFDVTPRTLRYYEYIELLSPVREGRARFYGPREVARMTLIIRGRHFGFSLEEVRQWLEIYDRAGSAAQMRALVEASERQLEKLTRQIEELTEARDALKSLRRATIEVLTEHVDVRKAQLIQTVELLVESGLVEAVGSAAHSGAARR